MNGDVFVKSHPKVKETKKLFSIEYSTFYEVVFLWTKFPKNNIPGFFHFPTIQYTPFFFDKKYYNPFQYIFLRRDKTRHRLVPHPRQRNIYIHQYYIYNFHIGHYTSGCIAYIGHSHKFYHHKTYNPLLVKSIVQHLPYSSTFLYILSTTILYLFSFQRNK